MVHGYVYEKRYIMHEISGMSIVALESYTTVRGFSLKNYLTDIASHILVSQ